MTPTPHTDALPEIRTPVPGEASRALADRLRRVESRNVTYRGESFPIFWARAEGSNVWDADGNRYVDLTAGFGVAALGHGHPEVRAAIARQAEALIHGMGDVHPPAVKTEYLEELARVTPWAETRAVLGVSGSEAVEIALKTACVATGKPGVLCFGGAYHGLTYGALAVTDRAHFRAPFEAQLNPHVLRVPYPHPYRPADGLRRPAPPGRGPGGDAAGAGGGSPGHPPWPDPATLADRALSAAKGALDSERGARVGAVIVEPIQGRGGDVVPPARFLPALAELCRARDLLLIVDEIYTGFGRAGAWLASADAGVEPDLVCVGKAASGGLPIAACLGRAEVMDEWPASRGEAMHTTTFLGHPIACAAAGAAVRGIRAGGLPARAREVGGRWLEALEGLARRHPTVGDVRGRGLMIGIDLVRDRESRRPHGELAARVVAGALRRGWVLLPSGPDGNVLSLSPPLTIEERLLDAALDALDELLAEAGTA